MLCQQTEISLKPRVGCHGLRSPEDLLSCYFSVRARAPQAESSRVATTPACNALFKAYVNGRAESRQPGCLGLFRKLSVPWLNFVSLFQTVSTLVVADSRASGIYSCKAFNKIGTVERNIKFYVTGKPYLTPPTERLGGLSLSSALLAFNALGDYF